MLASTHLYIDSMQDFMAAGRRVMTELGPEAAKFTNVKPLAANLRVSAAA